MIRKGKRQINHFKIIMLIILLYGWIPFAYIGGISASNNVNIIFNRLANDATISPQQAENMMFQIGFGLKMCLYSIVWATIINGIYVTYRMYIVIFHKR